MAALIEININLDKLKKEHIVQGEKGKYYRMTLSVGDEVNDYNQNISVYDVQTKEQRENKEKKHFLGGGITFWTDGKIQRTSDITSSLIDQSTDEKMPWEE